MAFQYLQFHIPISYNDPFVHNFFLCSNNLNQSRIHKVISALIFTIL